MVEPRIRSFIAVDIENEGVLRALEEAQKELVRTGADLKLVSVENLHFTLKFLGEIEKPRVDGVVEELSRLRFEAFESFLKGLGAFPSLSHVNVVWTSISKGVRELESIFQVLESRIVKLGFQPENRRFNPHLTLARVKTGRNRAALVECIRRMAEDEFGAFKVENIRLKRSVLTPQGPSYSTLYNLSLTKPEDATQKP